MMGSHNLTLMERGIRGVIGVLILGLYGAVPAPGRYLCLVGLLPLGTALRGYCPTYAFAARMGRRIPWAKTPPQDPSA